MSANNVGGVLEILLDRLYILRNQLMHGGVTYKSTLNRKSVKDGSRILEMLIPIIIEIILENPEEDWGETVVSDGAIGLSAHFMIKLEPIRPKNRHTMFTWQHKNWTVRIVLVGE